MNRNYILLVFFVLLQSLQCKADTATDISKNLNHLILADTLTDELSVTKYSFYYTDFSNSLLVTDMKKVAWKEFNKTPTLQPDNFTHWFKIVIKNQQNKDINKVLYIPYNSIYIIDIYQENSGTVNRIVETGMKRSVFNKGIKTIGYPTTLNLKANSTSSIYVKFKHTYRPLRASMYLLSENRLSEILYNSQALIWLWRGIYLFAIIVSIIAYLFLKQKSFLFYSLLNAGVSFYVFSHICEIPLIMKAAPANFSLTLDYLGTFLFNLSLPLFINSLTPIKENNKMVWKVMFALIFGMIPFMLIAYTPLIRLNFATSIVHNYIIIVSSIVLILQIYFLLKNTIRREKNALALLIVYSTYIVFSFVDIILPNMGVIEDNIYIYKRFLIGSFIEVFSFMFLMSRQTLNVYNEHTQLEDRLKSHQKELLYSIVKSQEVERIRTGRELHDLIGANLAIIKQKINSQDIDLRNLISHTIEAIRKLSHGFVVADIEDNEFIDEIKQLCYSASTDNMKFHVYFHKWPLIGNTDITTHLFRITQEMVQNAIKHSEASNVYLQFIGKDNNNILLMYEDNGIGFDSGSEINNKGLGITNIINRVDLLNGSLQIESNRRGTGTNIIIEINYNSKTIKSSQ